MPRSAKPTKTDELRERLEHIEAALNDMQTTLNLLIHLLDKQEAIEAQAATKPQETNDNGD